MARSKHDPLKQALSFEKPVVELDIQLKELTDELAEKGDDAPAELLAEIEKLEGERDERLAAMQEELTVWQRIQLSRHIDRPVTGDYTDALLTDLVELHGDRTFGDDRAILTALATLGDRKLLLVAHRKGRTTKERIACNWGCAHPEGYRKAQRAMKLAERLGLPVLTLINTPGAYPGLEAEERGQAGAIAWAILEMAALRVPVVSVVIGEGGSGGALGIGVCDRLMVLENSYYSVITPEGCASILWKDGSRAEEAASALKLSTTSLADLGVADEILPEPLGGAHRDKARAAEILGEAVERHFAELSAMSVDELMAARRAKYRKLGQYGEGRRPARR
ncbi:MAG: acetyl-coenzyme A carboxylase carboxyl transferase subunit alpha [Planctomycetota bacterium]|nr:MAG: acetyl-coenzyme A carboxylase carboxyl transferase subunit alpha [Planctomycetota bacterium]